jgi:hypothetical protein
MPKKSRFAIVTPYYKEGRDLLQRCIDSVKAQEIPCDHIVVADGFPQDWIDCEPVRHMKLDQNHADYGNTPRGVGSLLAAAEGYEGIGLLDADNWYDPNHVKVCIEAAETCSDGIRHCDYVIARRRIRHVNGAVLPTEFETGFADTNCFFLLPGSYSVIPCWALMPRQVAPLCDKVFHRALTERAMRCVRVADKVTVNYYCLWRQYYIGLGLRPPPEATHSLDWDGIDAWIRSLDARDYEIANRLCGTKLPEPS